MFKGISELTSLLKNAGQIGQQMKGMSEQLRSMEATGTAGGGMVEIEMNGLMEVLRVHIEPALMEQGDAELVEQLVSSALNQAIRSGKELHTDALRTMTGGMSLPGLDGALEQFLEVSAEEEKEEEEDG